MTQTVQINALSMQEPPIKLLRDQVSTGKIHIWVPLRRGSDVTCYEMMLCQFETAMLAEGKHCGSYTSQRGPCSLHHKHESCFYFCFPAIVSGIDQMHWLFCAGKQNSILCSA